MIKKMYFEEFPRSPGWSLFIWGTSSGAFEAGQGVDSAVIVS